MGEIFNFVLDIPPFLDTHILAPLNNIADAYCWALLGIVGHFLLKGDYELCLRGLVNFQEEKMVNIGEMRGDTYHCITV